MIHALPCHDHDQPAQFDVSTIEHSFGNTTDVGPRANHVPASREQRGRITDLYVAGAGYVEIGSYMAEVSFLIFEKLRLAVAIHHHLPRVVLLS
jgi:hypothetical protein